MGMMTGNRFVWRGILLAGAVVAGCPLYATEVIPPKVYSMSPGGVNVSDGSFPNAETDFQIGPLKLERFRTLSNAGGVSLKTNFSIYIIKKAYPPQNPVRGYYKFIVHLGARSGGFYRQWYNTSPSAIEQMNGEAASGILAFVNNTYVYTDNDGAIYHFDTSMRATDITFPDGRLQTLSYGSNGLKLVSDSSGYAIVFDYNANGWLSAACGFNTSQTYVSTATTCDGADLKVSYAYDASFPYVLPSAVTDVQGQVTTYTFGGVGTLPDGTSYSASECIKPPGYTVCKVTNYGSIWQVGRQVMADGSVWKYVAGSSGFTAEEAPTDGGNEGSMTDPAGKTWNYLFTGSSPYQFTDPNGRITQYRYAGGGGYDTGTPPSSEGSLLVDATDAEGGKYTASYGPYNMITRQTRKAKPGSGLADILVETGYSCPAPNYPILQCTRPIWVKDAKGNQTDFAYTAYGAIQSEMQPAPTSGAARPLKLYTYVQKYAYMKNAGGTLVALATPIWMPDTMTECQTAAGSSPTPACDTSAPQRVTTWEYASGAVANNLLARGVVVTASVGGTSTSLRTCYGYDARGRRISTTTPRGTTTAACS